MQKPILDDYCKRIFITLYAAENPVRFNGLYKSINGIGAKMTRPTLITHLRHLQKEKLITRKKEGKQSVSYAVKWTKLEPLKETMKTKQHIEHILGNEKRFKSMSIKDQVMYVALLHELRDVWKLKLKIRDAIDPSKNFEHNIQFLLTNRFFNFFENWLLEDCHLSKTEDAPKALSMIDDIIETLTRELFENAPKNAFLGHEQTAASKD